MEKVCGTCAQCLPVIGHCDERNDTVDLHEKACRDWRERTEQTIEQRYAQLEQVAKNMFATVIEHNRMGFYGGIDMTGFRDQLEALGVELQ